MRLAGTFFLFLFLSVHAGAQVQFNDLEGLLQYADVHAPAAQQARLQPMMAKDDKRLAASSLYPRLNGFATGDYYPLIQTLVIPGEIVGKPGTYVPAKLGLPYVFTAGAELSIPVINLEKWTQLSKAKVQAQKSGWSSKAALEAFHIQLIQVYYQTLATKEVLKVNEENVKTANELLRIITERDRVGVVNPSDYNRTVNLQRDVKTTRINYERMFAQGVNNLQAMMNIQDDSLVMTEGLTDFNWPAPQADGSASTRPGWQEANLNVRIAELSLGESRKGGLPRLSLNSRYAYNMQSELTSGGKNIEFDVANIGMRLDVPLFQGNYYRTLIHKNKLQLKWAQLEQQKVQSTLTQQNNDWFAQYLAAYNKQAILKEKVATASDNLRIANLNIKEGVIEFDEYNNIFVEYNRARIEYLQNLADGILYYLLSTQNF